MTSTGKAYFVGGIGSLAADAFLIRDGGMPGGQISILEDGPVMGGSLDGAGNADRGNSMRGGRTLITDNYDCVRDLFKSIPSLAKPGRSVFDETLEFNERHVSNAMARLVDSRRAKVPVASMGYSMHDRVELLKLGNADDSRSVPAASPITCRRPFSRPSARSTRRRPAPCRKPPPSIAASS